MISSILGCFIPVLHKHSSTTSRSNNYLNIQQFAYTYACRDCSCKDSQFRSPSSLSRPSPSHHRVTGVQLTSTPQVGGIEEE